MTDCDISEQEAVDLAAAYLETAFHFLDRGDIGATRAALRRCAQYLLHLDRWDAVNGGHAKSGEEG